MNIGIETVHASSVTKMRTICVKSIVFSLWLFEALAEPTRIGGVSGLSRNVNILCLDNNQAATVFWIINGSVYGLLQVPDEFILCKEETCDLKDLTISVLQSEMDGYTFQCVGIDYNTNTHHLGRQAELSVTTLPQGGSFNVTDIVRRDVLELHYPELSVGPINTSIGWTYSNLTCQPSVFTIEGYDAVPDPLQPSSPPLTLTSTSSVLTFPTSTIHHNITHASFYLRLLAHDVSGTACAPNSTLIFYKLNKNFPTPVPISPSPDGEGCVPIPVGLSSTHDSSSLEVVWSERHDTVGRLCYCPPFEGTLGLFSQCISTTSCHTDYSIVVRNNSICFAAPSPQLTNIPVYFTLLESCADSRCVIRSIVTSFIIVFAPPPPPVVYSTNTSVCFWSRSPVESYLVTVTDVNGTNTSLSGTYNTSQCLTITSDLSPDVCGPFMASVVTVNGVGKSNITVHQLKIKRGSVTETVYSQETTQVFSREEETETSTSSEVSTQPWPVVIILSNVVVNLIIALLAAVAIVIVCTYQEIMKHSTPNNMVPAIQLQRVEMGQVKTPSPSPPTHMSHDDLQLLEYEDIQEMRATDCSPLDESNTFIQCPACRPVKVPSTPPPPPHMSHDDLRPPVYEEIQELRVTNCNDGGLSKYHCSIHVHSVPCIYYHQPTFHCED